MNSLYKNKRFRYIILANVASSIGSGITMIAIPWLLVTGFMKKQPGMFLFLLATSLPFISVMLTNNLFPVYLADVLKVEGVYTGSRGWCMDWAPY